MPLQGCGGCRNLRTPYHMHLESTKALIVINEPASRCLLPAHDRAGNRMLARPERPLRQPYLRVCPIDLLEYGQ